jgi:uncharacterized membrane protein (GlpM family)
MTVGTIAESQRRAARVIGFTYLLAMASAIVGFYIRGHLTVAGNAAETAHNIMASERLFRVGIASDVVTFVTDIVLITALYVVLKPVNRNLALLATFWRLMETAVLLVVTLNGFEVLRFLSGADYLGAFEADRLQALARLSLVAYGTGYNVGFVFLGLGSAVFCYLWLRSDYIPRALAALGLLASLVMATCNFAFIVLPSLEKTIGPGYMAPMGIFEVTMGFWLLLKGLGPSPTAEPDKAPR